MIEIKEEVRIGNIILEKGDKIEVLRESTGSIKVDLASFKDAEQVYKYFIKQYNTYNIIGNIISLSGGGDVPFVEFIGNEKDLENFYVKEYNKGSKPDQYDDFSKVYNK